MTIYLDVLFIKEFLINFVIIYIKNKILNKSNKINKTLLGCLIGSSYTIICLFLNPRYIYIGRVFCVLLIVFVTSDTKTIPEFFKSLLTFYIVTFFVSGLCFYTYGEKTKTYIYIIISILLISELIKSYKENFKILNYLCNIEINVEQKNIKMKALIDTGHNLTSAFGEEVIVISPQIIKYIKGTKIEKILLKNEMYEENEYAKNIRIISYNALGQTNGLKIRSKNK